MSEFDVADMPEDAMVEVFKWLDPKSLKNVMLTCKQWNDFVECSTIAWKLFIPHKKHRVDDDCFESALKSSTRKFREATIIGLDYSLGSKLLDSGALGGALKILEMHAVVNIRTLTLERSVISAKTWCKLLTMMPNLEKLVTEKVSSAFAIEEDITKVAVVAKDKLTKLKTLELRNNFKCYLWPCFQNCQLKRLAIYNDFYDEEPQESLLNFLATQEGLQEMALEFNSYGVLNLFGAPLSHERILFRLKKLSLSGVNFTWQNSNHMMPFMKLHKETLVEFDSNRIVTGDFIDVIFRDFRQLKSLGLSKRSILQHPSFYERLAVNASVISLKLNNDSTQICDDTNDIYRGFLKGFVDHLPNIQNLSLIGRWEKFEMEIFARSLRKLKAIEVTHFDEATFNGVKFHSLQTMRIESLLDPVNWDAFTKDNPEINELSINLISLPDAAGFYNHDLPAITENLTLRKLTIEGINIKLNLLRRDPKKLSRIEVD